MTTQRYIAGEIPVLEGKFGTGNTVTITIIRLSDMTAVVSAAACAEDGTTGFFHYHVSLAPTDFQSYRWVMTNGISSQDVGGHIDVNGYPVADFNTLKKASLNAATPASIQNIAANGSGFTALGDTRLANLDALISSRLATAGYTTPPTKDQIADQVWDEQISGHTATGSTGKILSSGSAPSVSEIDAQLSGNHGAGAWGASAVGTIAYPDPEEPFLEDGNPMVGVKVEAFSNSARTALVDAQITDVNGNFQFHLNAGEYWFRASLAGHSNYEWSVVLE